MNKELLQAALAYAQRGLPVFPCATKGGKDGRGKTPLTPHGFKDATTDETQIRAWWTKYPDAQIGMATGKRSGYDVIDTDAKHDGERVLTGLAAGKEIVAPQVHTGGGGYHRYFVHDPRLTIDAGITVKGKKVFGVDLRGEGGYVIVPPSPHASGTPYSGEVPDPKNVTQMPEWLVEMLLTEDAEPLDTRLDAGPVVEGGRNDTLFHIGCKLRAQNWDDEEIAGHLQLVNGKRCKPPLNDSELLTIIEQVLKYEPGTEVDRETARRVNELRKKIPSKPETPVNRPTPTPLQTDVPPRPPPPSTAPFESIRDLTSAEVDELSKIHEAVPYTDAGNAEYFVARYGEMLRYVVETNRWIVWDTKRWREDPSEKFVLKLAEQAMRARLIEIANGAEVKKTEMNMAITALGAKKLGYILDLAGTRVPVTYYALNGKPYLLNVQNGVVDLRNSVLRPHDPNDMMTQMAKVSYNPDAECPRFFKFWKEVLPEVDINYLQRWFGYCLTGENREKKMQIWEGKRGNNGKSTIKNLLIDILGDYSIEVSVSVFVGKNRDYKNDDLVPLKHMRLVFAGEPEDGAILNSSLIKRMTGMDRIHCRPLHSNEWVNYEPVFKPIVLTNHELRVYDTDDAFWRRPDLIRFNQVFEGEKDNKHLLEELKTETEGIFAWMVKGAVDWYREGLLGDSVVKKETDTYRERQDTFGDFLESYELGEVFGGISPPSPRWPILSGFLRTFYNNWAVKEGLKPLGKPKFKEQMEKHGFTQKHGESGWFWIPPADDTRMYKKKHPSIELTIPQKTDDQNGIKAHACAYRGLMSNQLSDSKSIVSSMEKTATDDTQKLMQNLTIEQDSQKSKQVTLEQADPVLKPVVEAIEATQAKVKKFKEQHE